MMFQRVNVATIAPKMSTIKAVIFKLLYGLPAAPFKIVHDISALTIGCTVLCASHGITKLWFPHWSHKI